MPRNGANIYSKPAGTTAVSGTTIESAKYNSTIDDLVTDANTPRAVIAGGTGAATLTGLLATLGGQPLDGALTSIAGLVYAADQGIHATGIDTFAVHTQTAFARTLLDDTTAAIARTTLGAQAADVDLDAISGLATTGLISRTGAGTASTTAIGAAGQQLVVSGGVPAWFGGTAGPTTASGTAVNFASIPANANKVTIFFDGLSLTGTDNFNIQLGTGGVAEATGYAAVHARMDATVAFSNTTTGFQMYFSGAANVMSGFCTFEKEPGSNAWHFSGVMNNQSAGQTVASGRKSLAGVLDFLRVIPSGANTFDAGTISIRWSM